MSDIQQDEHLPSRKRLRRDLVEAAKTLSDTEARFLVDSYYTAQDERKRSDSQIREMREIGEPHLLVGWIADQSENIENQIKRALEVYTEDRLIGRWLKSIYGIGPVISAGLIAHVDIKLAPTAGHLWSYGGMNPTQVWAKKTKRPWNADFKTLCWKVGQSFMKFSGAEECVYGHIYQQRKMEEVARNDSGRNADAAKKALAEKNYDKKTDAYKHYMAGHLPPAHVDARARRFVVKLFLSHFQLVWWYIDTGNLPPKPYAMEFRGHAHFLMPPNTDIVEGLTEALLKY